MRIFRALYRMNSADPLIEGKCYNWLGNMDNEVMIETFDKPKYMGRYIETKVESEFDNTLRFYFSSGSLTTKDSYPFLKETPCVSSGGRKARKTRRHKKESKGRKARKTRRN